MKNEYECVIGLEIHVELSTVSKIFCRCPTTFGAGPNTLICPVCLGMPGSLPVLNRRVVEYAVKLGLALGCEISPVSRFDRKNYFYPDNPQNYQISQLYSPIGTKGAVMIEKNGLTSEKQIRIHEIHMEEDAGKLIHSEETSETFIDYNRAGIPLIEIVTEPDMREADEVIAFLEKLHRSIRYLGISDCRMNEGSMRVDVNLSVRRRGLSEELSQDGLPDTYRGDDRGAFGIRTEMKNLNSFRAIVRAIEAERDRQIAILESGGSVLQETRRWDDDQGISFPMRSKEDAMDYRYFPEPDLPPVVLSEERIEEIRQDLPEMPEEKIIRYRKVYQLSDYDIGILTDDPALAMLFERTVDCGADPKQAANWLMGETIRRMKEKEWEPEDLKLDPAALADLIDLTNSNTINSTTAKDVFGIIFEHTMDVKKYVEDHGLAMIRDTDGLEETVTEILTENPGPVSDYQAGKKKAIGFLVGQVMKQTKGRADPELVRELLEKHLES